MFREEPVFTFSSVYPLTVEELLQVLRGIGQPGSLVGVAVSLTVPDTVEEDLAAVTVPDPGQRFLEAVGVADDGQPTPVNRYLIGTTIAGNQTAISLPRVTPDTVSPEEACEIAAWIVALADPLGKVFPAKLAAVWRS